MRRSGHLEATCHLQATGNATAAYHHGVSRADDAGGTRKASADELLTWSLVGAELAIESGPDRGRKIEIGPTGLVVGSGSGADVCLTDPLVSRKHVELRAEADGVRVTDLRSLNGTKLGSVRVREVLLTEDAALTVGESVLRVTIERSARGIRLSPRTEFGDAIAESPAMRHVFELLERAARTDVTVLLEGDSGTGKDVLAHALHRESPRREAPFIVVDCGAIPEQLVESELFGHEKGAFTGAHAARAGAFEQAEGGTVFLDEIGELPLDAQPKLLRALESRSFRRVGGNVTVRVDVRVVAATNRRLREAVRRKEFRDDLYYRLAVVHISVPRLADRPEDVLPLAESFLRRVTGDPSTSLPEDLKRLLASYDWPGNARELRNVVERFATFDRADPKILFDARASDAPIGQSAFAGFELLPYHEAKRRALALLHRTVLPKALEQAQGSVPRAAEALGLPRQSLYRMLTQLDEEET